MQALWPQALRKTLSRSPDNNPNNSANNTEKNQNPEQQYRSARRSESLRRYKPTVMPDNHRLTQLIEDYFVLEKFNSF